MPWRATRRLSARARDSDLRRFQDTRSEYRIVSDKRLVVFCSRVQSKAGRMRNRLYPIGLASYIDKNAQSHKAAIVAEQRAMEHVQEADKVGGAMCWLSEIHRHFQPPIDQLSHGPVVLL